MAFVNNYGYIKTDSPVANDLDVGTVTAYTTTPSNITAANFSGCHDNTGAVIDIVLNLPSAAADLHTIRGKTCRITCIVNQAITVAAAAGTLIYNGRAYTSIKMTVHGSSMDIFADGKNYIVVDTNTVDTPVTT